MTPPDDGQRRATEATSSTPSNGAPPLTPAHVQLLKDRAIPAEVALLAGLRSVDAAEAGQLLGWSAPAFSGLAIPYLGAVPSYVRLRTDIGTPRYLCPKGREVPAYVPPSIDAPSVDGDLGDALIVVEAPLKALSLAAIGLHAVGLGGVRTTLDRKNRARLNNSWESTPLEGRLIIVLFDANRRTNPEVATAEARLVTALQDDGRARVRLADLPRGPRGKESWGPDDFLATHGREALLSVLAESVAGDPLERLDEMLKEPETEQRAERALALLGDNPFLASVLSRGVRARAGARNAFAKLGGGKRDLDRAIAEFEEAGHQHDAADAEDEDEDEKKEEACCPYTVRDGCFVHCGDEKKAPYTVCNFNATVTEDVMVDDGAEQTREFIVAGENKNGVKLPPIAVDSREFAGASAVWTTEKWGARAFVEADCNMHIRPAILHYSPNFKTKTVFAHTGYRSIDGRRVYLSANGAVGAEFLPRDVDVTVRLDTNLVRYALPKEKASREEVVHATRASLRLLKVAPDVVSISLLAATYRAPLSEFSPCDFVIWLVGFTGSFKTSLAATQQAHYGSFDNEHLPASWYDTVNALETKTFRVKDALLTIDDFAPGRSDQGDDMHRKAKQLVRNLGNMQSRSRLKADMNARADRPPRGLVLATAEDLPSGESLNARIFPIHVQREQVNLQELTALQQEATVLPIAMRAYIEHLIQIESDSKDFSASLKHQFAELRSEFARGLRGTDHPRSPSTAAHLALGWRCFVSFAKKVGAVTEDEADRLLERGRLALHEQLNAHTFVTVEQDPTQRFLRMLRSLIVAGRARLEEPDQPTLSQSPGVDFVGWKAADGKAHLIPEIVFGAVAKAMRESGQYMPVQQNTLWRRLKEQGLTTPGDEEGRYTVKRRHGDGRPRVIELLPGALDVEGDLPDPGESGDGAPDGGTAPVPAPNDSSAGPRQVAAPHEKNNKGPDGPGPAGGGGSPREGRARAHLETPCAQANPQGEPNPLPGTGATGAGGEGEGEKSSSSSELAAPRPSWPQSAPVTGAGAGPGPTGARLLRPGPRRGPAPWPRPGR
jgi:hypothetical protein